MFLSIFKNISTIFFSFFLSVCLSLYGATFLFGVDVALSYLPLCRKFKSFLFEMKWDGEEEREKEKERERHGENFKNLVTFSYSFVISCRRIFNAISSPPSSKRLLLLFFF